MYVTNAVTKVISDLHNCFVYMYLSVTKMVTDSVDKTDTIIMELVTPIKGLLWKY